MNAPGKIGDFYDVEAIRRDFPILSREVYGKPLVYLDNGASAQKPQVVLDTIQHAYSQEYLPGRETAWRRQFMAEQPRQDYLVIDNDSILWIAHQVSSTPMFQALSARGRAALEFNILRARDHVRELAAVVGRRKDVVSSDDHHRRHRDCA